MTVPSRYGPWVTVSEFFSYCSTKTTSKTKLRKKPVGTKFFVATQPGAKNTSPPKEWLCSNHIISHSVTSHPTTHSVTSHPTTHSVTSHLRPHCVIIMLIFKLHFRFTFSTQTTRTGIIPAGVRVTTAMKKRFPPFSWDMFWFQDEAIAFLLSPLWVYERKSRPCDIFFKYFPLRLVKRHCTNFFLKWPQFTVLLFVSRAQVS